MKNTEKAKEIINKALEIYPKNIKLYLQQLGNSWLAYEFISYFSRKENVQEFFPYWKVLIAFQTNDIKGVK